MSLGFGVWQLRGLLRPQQEERACVGHVGPRGINMPIIVIAHVVVHGGLGCCMVSMHSATTNGTQASWEPTSRLVNSFVA